MTPTNHAHNHALGKLKLRWVWPTAFTILLVIASYFLLGQLWPIGARNWVLLSAAVLIYELAILFADLEKNISVKTNKLSPDFGPGTWLSVVRLISLGLLAGFLAAPQPPAALAWLPFGLALVFHLSDVFDGYLARRFGTATVLGAKLDLDLDSRGMLVTSMMAIHLGMVGWWFVFVGLARYIYVSSIWLRRRGGLSVAKLRPNPFRRPFAGVEMGFATALLAPIFSPVATNFAATITLIPFLGNFFYDWLQVTRRLPQTKNNGTIDFPKKLLGLFSLLLRAAVFLLLVRRVYAFGWSDQYLVIESLAAFALAFGIAARPASLLALIETCIRLKGQPTTPADFVLLFGLTALVYFGTGPFSLWNPEQPLISHRLGDLTIRMKV
jgi:CDP-diacylglycerol--glycerol-3-phosphate 3-phosphatidyltransferase